MVRGGMVEIIGDDHWGISVVEDGWDVDAGNDGVWGDVL